MAYIAPTITVSGLSIPSYNDILNDLIGSYQTVYGQNVYLANDSADYQFLSIIALKIYDVMQAIQFEYNNRSPVSAIGVALDSLVKLNGITRKVASFSTCSVTLVGTPGSVITNGQVSDVNGNTWILPTPVTIGGGGFVTVTAICSALGAVTADIGDIQNIVIPQAGWTSVTNTEVAIPGQPIETDAQLRARQALSTELPSNTLLAGTIAAIAAIAGVTRWNVRENITNYTDAYGLISHSIWVVIEGGLDATIAQMIFENKGPGCGTNGTTTVAVVDSVSKVIDNIKFSRPTYIPVFATLDVHLLEGGTTETLLQIQTAVIAYLNSLQIGEIVTLSALYGAALSVMPDLSVPMFSIYSLTMCTQSGAKEFGLNADGSGYTVANNLPTTGGSGTGLIVNITSLNAGGIEVAGITVANPGSGYEVGDIITVVQGEEDSGSLVIDTLTLLSDKGTKDIPIAFDAVAQGLAGSPDHIIVNNV